MNHSDSERIASFLEQCGFAPAKKMEDADLAVFNTCGIRQAAENRAYGVINNLRKTSRSKRIILTGCLAHRKDVRRRLKDSVDLFTEMKDFTSNAESFVGSLDRSKERKPGNLTDKERIDYLSISPKHTNDFQAYVPIMTGCNNFCAYCVVPYARGREVSRPAKEIVAEVKGLVKNGYKHVILLGQNVNSYTDGAARITFPKLLKKIDRIPGKFWISFVSSHPKDFSDELIGAVAECKKTCEWIHLPVQAGNDKILGRMNRRYSKDHYLKLIGRIRRTMEKSKPGTSYAISSDIIVGFPGETRKQFSDSADVMEKAKFDMVFFGQFSPRPGTAAWEMKDNVSKKEKERREKYLNEILKKTALGNNMGYVGKTMEVLIEKNKDGACFGKTRTMKNVRIVSSKKIEPGSFVKARITKANTWNLEGTTR